MVAGRHDQVAAVCAEWQICQHQSSQQKNTEVLKPMIWHSQLKNFLAWSQVKVFTIFKTF